MPNASAKTKKLEEYGSILDFINEVYLLPYLTIGGTRETFWQLTPKDLEIDFRAYKKRQENQLQLAWLSGLYVRQAIQSSYFVCILADKKTKLPKYPEAPKNEEDQKVLDEETQTKLMVAKMEKWLRFNNKSRKQ